MIRPSMDEIRAMERENTLVPICLELFSDLTTPIEVLRCLKAHSKQCYLLESVEGGEKWGRYSFLGFDPKLTVTCAKKVVTVNSARGSETFTESPDDVVRRILSEHKSPRLPFMPPFTGGFVGYFAYDYVQYSLEVESLEALRDTVGFDDLHLMLFDKVIVFDHLRQKIILIVNIGTDDIEKNYVDGVIALKEMENRIRSPRERKAFPSKLLSDFEPLFSKEKYCEMVERAKGEIFEGNIFQVVVANRMEARLEGDLLPSYRVLRTINPSPYMFYVDFDGLQIAGASPETLVSLKDGTLSTFPIAGTCKRGATEQEDEALISRLQNDEKELAEHDMLVDLGCNDLGKISEFGSVEVKGYRQILRFSHVAHITSTVTGTLKQGMDQLDALGAILPAGTLSGAPKERSIDLISELEGEKRGVYGGAVGYIDFSGNMDVCIAIRMAVKKGDGVYVTAGAGIVADSNPESEYAECSNKARAMISAIENSREVE